MRATGLKTMPADRRTRPGAGGRPRRAAAARTRRLLAAAALLLLPACQQKMAQQPYYRPLDPTAFFDDGRSARPLARGVFHRTQFLSNDPMVNGLTEEARRAGAAPVPPAPEPGEAKPPPGVPDALDKYVTAFPFPIGPDDLKRGQERFTIYCVACHGPLGDGRGKIWERGYLQPTNFHTENSRGFARWGIEVPMPQVPVGYYYEVISRGYGGMPDYALQVEPADRWRIIAYIRALQLSRAAELDRLPAAQRQAALEALGEQKK